jgi:hypothetical protein
MHISGEGKLGIALGLVGLAGGGAMMVAPTHTEIGWTLIAIAVAGFVTIGIHHFRGHSPFRSRMISLQDASRELYEAMRGTEWGSVMDRQSRDPNDVLAAAAYYIIYRVNTFVRKPPSRKVELFDKNNLSSMAVMGGAKEIRHTKSNAVAFVDPSVRRSDLRKLIRELRKRQPH